MRRIRRRLITILVFLASISSIVTLLVTWMVESGILFKNNADIRILILGYAAKELVIFALAIAIIVIAIFFFSKRTADPIAELSQAAKKIADGNYDIHLEESDRRDELGSLYTDFNHMAEELQSNELLKKDFISNVSHEFKTPLSILEGYAKLLSDPQISDEDRIQYAKIIQEESHRLSTITGKMLYLSRINAAQAPLKTERYYLDEQIRQIILTLQSAWSKKNLNLTVDLDPVKYEGDKELMAQVWMNLLDNAIKFSPENGKLSISLRPYPQNIRFQISDQGEGISREAISHVFDQFYQEDTSHRKDGSGLGLSIVKRIIDLHQGEISVESIPGKGSTFTVIL